MILIVKLKSCLFTIIIDIVEIQLSSILRNSHVYWLSKEYMMISIIIVDIDIQRDSVGHSDDTQ